MTSAPPPATWLTTPAALAGKRVLVMGLGVHGGGVGVVSWLLHQHAIVTVTDLASAECLAASLQVLRETEQRCGNTIRYVLGEHRRDDITSHDLIIVNPAVPPHSPWLALAHQAAVPVETEMSLFFRFCAAPIVGITGTKGKTTTTMLTAAMLRRVYPQTLAAGNNRVSALAALNEMSTDTPVVLELSSFQLERLGATGLSPAYACVTNFSADHLDYHGSMEAYATAKQHIVRHQHAHDVVVLNRTLERSWFQAAGAQVRTFSAERTTMQMASDCCVTPQGSVVCCGEYLFDVADIPLRGKHNLENVLAAAALAHSFGIGAADIRAAVCNFGGVEHRMELVRTLDGVAYINDTTATNPAATIAALQALHEPLILIAGGANKQLDFADLSEHIARRVQTLVLLAGSATEQIERGVRAAMQPGTPGILGPYEHFTDAIAAAREAATVGTVVLLSPGCASFGMFRNEFHRGEEFRRIVMALT